MVSSDIQGLRVHVFETTRELALNLADHICQLADAAAGDRRSLVLGLAAGMSPHGTYRALELRRRTGQLDLSGALAFGVDEYYPINPEAPQSFTRQLTRVAAEIGLPIERLSLLRGSLPPDRVPAYCAEFEETIRRAGGIDLQLLGIGRNGHLGFNEPGSSASSRTRLVSLSEQTRQDAAGSFGGVDLVPRRAITMGLGTILEAREIALVAIGIHKAPIVKLVVEREPSAQLPASLLRRRSGSSFYLDSAAASLIASDLLSHAAAAPSGSVREVRY